MILMDSVENLVDFKRSRSISTLVAFNLGKRLMSDKLPD